MKPTTYTVTIMLLAATAHAGVAQGTGQRCENPQPYLGIKTFHCQGGSCMVRGWSATINERLSPEMERLKQETAGAWAFSVEPRLWEIDPAGPAIRAVREGDVLVAVDGDPITTRRGGMRLAQIDAGQPVRLTLRRTLRSNGVPYDVVTDAEVVPVPACATLSASAGPGDRPAQTEPASFSYSPARSYTYGIAPGVSWAVSGDSAHLFRYGVVPSIHYDVAPRALYGLRDSTISLAHVWTAREPEYSREALPAHYGLAPLTGIPSATYAVDHAARDADVVRLDGLGLVLAGAKEITIDADGTVRWRFATQPYVKEVVADSRAARAGIQPGEFVVQAGDKFVTTIEGAAALTVGAGETVALWVRRGNAARRIVVR